jgi:hypothetical protein
MINLTTLGLAPKEIAMTKSGKLFLIAAGVILCVSPLFGHHGTAASYDQKRVVRIEGTVIEFLWRNPHSALFLKGKDSSGKAVEYSIELYSPGQMVKLGYTKDVFKPGDHVIIEPHPSFTNPTASECLGCNVIVNGKEPGNPKTAGAAQ